MKYEVNTLKENGEIATSNTCDTLKLAVSEYNDLGAQNKELIEVSDNETDFYPLYSFDTEDYSGDMVITDYVV